MLLLLGSCSQTVPAANWIPDDTLTPEEQLKISEFYQKAHMNRDLMADPNTLYPTSCCGVADAYWTDKVRFDDMGEMYVTVTDKRDISGRKFRDGDEILVPIERIDHDRQVNPTEHNILFIGANGNMVYCFFPYGGS